MKIAIINHDTSVYGASKSLRTYLPELCKSHDVTLYLPKSINIFKKTKIDHKSFFGIDKIEYIFQPFSLCYKGEKRLFKTKIKFFIINVFFYLIKYYLISKLKKQNYSKIILNSIVLHPFIVKDINFVLHVRESAKINSFLLRNMKNAQKIIFIDYSTQNIFLKYNKIISKSYVINNPFNMSKKICNFGVHTNILSNSKIICAMIGQIADNKGVDFVLNAFSKLDNKKYILLIIGKIYLENDYHKKCINFKSSNVIFLDEIKDIVPFYSYIDIVIRGESFFTIGRTIYEGLFSSCNVLIPGSLKNISQIYEYDKFSRNIFFYRPRDIQSFLNQIREINKVIKRQYYSNVEEYINEFNNILSS